MQDPQLQRARDLAESGSPLKFTLRRNGMLLFRGQICVSVVEPLRELILQEAHSSAYTMHLGSTKMYRTLKQTYWWNGMKRDIVQFISKYLVCQQIKVEHQSLTGKIQPLFILEWKWKHITMDFMIGLPKTRRGNNSTWVIVDRLTKFAHFFSI